MKKEFCKRDRGYFRQQAIRAAKKHSQTVLNIAGALEAAEIVPAIETPGKVPGVISRIADRLHRCKREAMLPTQRMSRQLRRALDAASNQERELAA